VQIQQKGGHPGQLTPAEVDRVIAWITAGAPESGGTASPLPLPTVTLTSTLSIGSTQVSDKDGMTLLYVPAGNFILGSGNDSSNEKEHGVYLDAFWIDQTEVTNEMYSRCVVAGICQVPSPTKSHTRDRYYGYSAFDNYPVVNVLWEDAAAYCQWAGRALPTEAQWEKAARGEDGRTYPWGSLAPDATRLNYHQNVGDTTEVGKYVSGASPYGALDMSGNVWEWVADWYAEKYYASSPARNPTGPTSGDYHVIRGGSWIVGSSFARVSIRLWSVPNPKYGYLGFRCAR
jgi:formylglycine-generating enzyme required for sulfatase activity